MFDATYTNDEYGFTFEYPSAWKPAEKSGATVFAASRRPTMSLIWTFGLAGMTLASRFQGADGVNVSVSPAGSSSTPEVDFAKAIKAAYDESPGLKNMGATANIESSKITVLADGKTFAVEAVVTARIMIANLWGYSLGANKGDKGITLSGFTLGGQAARDQIMAICRTLALT